METNSSENASPARGRSWLWKTVLFVLVACAVARAVWPGKATAKLESVSNEEHPVAAAKVMRQDISLVQVFDAEFRPYEEIDLHAKVSGFVDKLLVDVGDRVKAGQLLATIEIPELADDLDHAQAMEQRSIQEVKKAEAAHEEAHLAYTRLAAVDKARPRLVAQQEIDLAVARDRGTEAGVEAARSQVEVSKADVKKLRTMLKYTQITAPFDGVITKRYADRGALVQGGNASGLPLVRLSQNERLRLVFPVSVSSVHLVKMGDPVEIQVPAVGKKLQGTVSRFTRKIEANTRTMEVEADVPNPNLELVPGMYASAALDLEHRRKTLVVPVEAVSRKQTATVYLIRANHEIEERTVGLGLETPGQLEVLTGLQENDLVMVGSRALVKPGQHVLAKVLPTKKSE